MIADLLAASPGSNAHDNKRVRTNPTRLPPPASRLPSPVSGGGDREWEEPWGCAREFKRRAAPRPLIVTNDLFSDDGLGIVAIFFFASFFFSGLWKKVGARGDRGLDCLCAARAPWRYEFKAPAHETLGGRLSNATVHRQQTHTLDAVPRGLHYKGCARSGQAGAAQEGVASC